MPVLHHFSWILDLRGVSLDERSGILDGSNRPVGRQDRLSAACTPPLADCVGLVNVAGAGDQRVHIGLIARGFGAGHAVE